MLGVEFILADTDYIGAIAVVVILVVWATRALSAIAKKSQPSPPKPRFAPPPPQVRPIGKIALPPLGARPVAARPAALPPIANLIVSPAPAAGRVGQVKSAVAPPLPPKRKDPVGPPVMPPPRTQAARWIGPRMLRSQFILAEALQPPLALRREPLG